MSFAAGDPPYRVSESAARVSEPTEPTRGPSTQTMTVCGSFAVVFWLGVIYQSLVTVPGFEKMFLDFKMRLPLATEWIIGLARGIWWIAPACLIASILVCAIPRSRWVGFILIFLVPLALNVFMVASLYFPYAALVEGLGGNAPPR